MSLKDKMERFNKRWNISSEESYEDAFVKFKTRILNIFKDIDHHLTDESISEFCQFYGIQEKWESSIYGDNRRSKNIITRLVNEADEKEFYKLIELIFALDIRTTADYYGGDTYSKNILYRKVREAIEYSSVNLSIATSNGEVILYPKGEEELDVSLVNYPLSFLKGSVGEHFVHALKFYEEKKHVKSAESIRRTLEEFLRLKLDNTRGLDANIIEVQKVLKTDGADAQVRNVINATFRHLDQYFNENSKHNDGDIDEGENEFLIYQAGLLMRYIEKTL